MIRTLLIFCLAISVIGCTLESPVSNTVKNNENAGNLSSNGQSLPAGNTLLNAIPSAYSTFPKKKGGACAFDQPSVQTDARFISGWSAVSAKEGVLPEAVILAITNNGTERYMVATKQPREDVAKYFKSSALLNSGFSASIKQTDAPAGSTISLYQVFQSVLYSCDSNLKIQ